MRHAAGLMLALALLLLPGCAQKIPPASPGEQSEYESSADADTTVHAPDASLHEGQPEEPPYTEWNGFTLYSVTLTGKWEGQVVERQFFDAEPVRRIAQLVLEQEALEDEEAFSFTEQPAIAVVVQDGPGSQFKLTLVPARDDETGEEAVLIRGELFSFRSEYAVYQELLSLLEPSA